MKGEKLGFFIYRSVNYCHLPLQQAAYGQHIEQHAIPIQADQLTVNIGYGYPR